MKRDEVMLDCFWQIITEDKISPFSPLSPVMKSPIQSRTRRPSLAATRAPPADSTDAAAAASSSSAVDDFEELMNEFTGDHLEEDMDPDMGEEDLLQELSEMIDS